MKLTVMKRFTNDIVNLFITVNFIQFHAQHVGGNLMGEGIRHMDVDRAGYLAGKTDRSYDPAGITEIL